MIASCTSRGRLTVTVLVLSTAVVGCRTARDGESGARRAPAVRERMLIGADALAARLARSPESIIVLHVARSQDEFDSAHIPGARILRLGDIVVERDGIPNELPPRPQLDSVLASAGASEPAGVVVYGEPLAAARAVVTLEAMGKGSSTALLDGGLTAWRAAGHPVSNRDSRLAGRGSGDSAALRPSRDPARIVDAEWVEAHRNHGGIALIDARPPEEFTGEKPGEGVERPGHIPGARNLFWKRLLQSDSLPLLLDTVTLRRLFVTAGAAPGDTVVVYCRTGMQASYAYFVARYLGYEARMYDGSFLDWARVPTRAVETGPAVGHPAGS
jgi:thiosulfate/3-mercaptopyruvate sulfurtransferase